MKILHIVEDYSIESGGLRTVINNLNKHLIANNVISYILSSKKENEDEVFIIKTKKPWLYSSKWKEKISNLHNEFRFDVMHIHGVWMFPQYLAAKYCINNNIPFILSTHGMYEPWLWKKGTFKKKFYFNFLAKSVFNKAKFLHAITPQEEENLKKLFKHNKVVEIPNLIDNHFQKKESLMHDKRYILFLGRLDKKKGIDLLLKSFANININDISLKIAGKVNDYKKDLDELINTLKIKHKVEFIGLISGQKKIEIIRNAFVLVAPSYSEVVGMVNLEAGILSTPVITTFQTGIKEEWNENGGFLINPNVSELTNALSTVLNWNDEQRLVNGSKLRSFVIENYSWQLKIKDWLNLYKKAIE